jgi:hypothetical protein
MPQKAGLINSSNAELNPICHLLALFGAHHILHVNRIRVKSHTQSTKSDNEIFITSTDVVLRFFLILQ